MALLVHSNSRTSVPILTHFSHLEAIVFYDLDKWMCQNSSTKMTDIEKNICHGSTSNWNKLLLKRITITWYEVRTTSLVYKSLLTDVALIEHSSSLLDDCWRYISELRVLSYGCISYYIIRYQLHQTYGKFFLVVNADLVTLSTAPLDSCQFSVTS